MNFNNPQKFHIHGSVIVRDSLPMKERLLHNVSRKMIPGAFHGFSGVSPVFFRIPIPGLLLKSFSGPILYDA